jgi:hypothetical protein
VLLAPTSEKASDLCRGIGAVRLDLTDADSVKEAGEAIQHEVGAPPVMLEFTQSQRNHALWVVLREGPAQGLQLGPHGFLGGMKILGPTGTRQPMEKVLEELVDFQAQSGSSELVFPSANSTPLRNRNFRRDSFDAAAAAVGLKITPHNLRDTAASLAIQAGASVVAVARLLGHESAATTLNHYAGLFPTDLDDVAVRLDAAAREAIGEQ